jgi:hypothetical protein
LPLPARYAARVGPAAAPAPELVSIDFDALGCAIGERNIVANDWIGFGLLVATCSRRRRLKFEESGPGDLYPLDRRRTLGVDIRYLQRHDLEDGQGSTVGRLRRDLAASGRDTVSRRPVTIPRPSAMSIAFASHGVGRRIVHPLLGTAPKGRVGSANLPNGRLTNSCNCRCLRRRRVVCVVGRQLRSIGRYRKVSSGMSEQALWACAEAACSENASLPVCATQWGLE